MGDLSYAVLDDNKMDKKIIGRIFSIHRIENVDFYDSENALFESGKNHDVYIIDIVLKDTSGDKVIMKLKEQMPESVVIAVSGIDNIKTISRVLSIGADDYITKPFNYDLFIARLKTNIRAFLLMQELRRKRPTEMMAVTDALTSLYNRRHIYDRLRQEGEKKSERYSSRFSVIMLDIDFLNGLTTHTGTSSETRF